MSDPPIATETKPASHREQALADARDFIDELRTIQKHDRGRMSALKRNAGEVLLGRGTAWFYGLLKTPIQKRNREVYYLIATLFDFNRRVSNQGDFGQALLQLCKNMKREPKDFRRFHILLDAELDRVHDPDDPESPWADGGGELAFRLRQMVKLMASKEVGINWPDLLVDLCSWSHPNRRVQKKWARSFFGDATPSSNSSNDES